MAEDNPLKYSDFIQPDASINDLIKQLEKLQTVYADLFENVKKEAEDVRKSIETMSGSQEQHRKTVKKAADDADRLAKAQEKLTESQGEVAEELARLRAEQQKQNNVNKLTAKLNDAAEGSYNKLSAQYSLNKLKLNALSKEQRANTKEGQELEKQTKAIYEEMKVLQEATGKHTLSVGDYEKGWKGLGDQLSNVPGATGAAAGGVKGLGASLKALLANPIVLFIAAIVGGVTALFSIFKKTKAGSDLFAKSAAALQGILSAITGIVSRLYEGLLAVFEDPQAAMEGFWDALKKNIVNRLQGVAKLVSSVSAAFNSLWNRDLEGAKKAALDAGKAFIQMNTGLDEDQQKAFAEAVRQTTKGVKDQALAFYELEEARLATQRANRKLEKSIEDIVTAEELQKAIADDVTKSFAEREAAAALANEKTRERAEIEKQIASDNLALLNRELDLRQANGEDVEELLDSQLEAYKTLKAAEREYLLTVRDNEKRLSELKQDRLEKDLDILIDGFDNQKTINERLIADETKTFSERQQLLDKTRELADDTFSKQISTISQFTDAQINANDLLAESDAVVLNQKIRSLGLSEIIEGRLLEIVRERRIVTQDLAEAEQDLNASRLEANRLEYDLKLRTYDEAYDFQMSEIELVKDTEQEKTRLRLQAERERLEKILALNKTGLRQLSDVQLNTMRNTLDKIDSEIGKIEQDQSFDIYRAVGLKLDDSQRQSIAQSTAFTVGQLQSILASNIAITDQAIQKNSQAIASAQTRLDAELEKQEQGQVNNVQAARREVEIAKQKERDLLKEKRKAQKAQFLLDTAQQTSSLITASANIWKSMSPLGPWGIGLALASIGTMFGSFVAAKVKARKLSQSQEFADGGWEILQGGSHASGNDIPLNMGDGRDRRAEGGEAFAVINKRNTAKYKSLLPNIFNSLNAGNFEKNFGGAFLDDPRYFINASGYDNEKLGAIEEDLNAIRVRGESKRTYKNEKGQTVEEYRNVKTIYV